MKKLITQSLSALLSLLGFSGCSGFGFGLCEYGTPTTDYQIRGTVTSNDGSPIKDIRVTIAQSEWDRQDTLYTDQDGKFASQILKDWYIGDQTVRFHDIDGEANGGKFKPDTLPVRNLDSKRIKKGDGDWYQGLYELKADIALSKESDEEAE